MKKKKKKPNSLYFLFHTSQPQLKFSTIVAYQTGPKVFLIDRTKEKSQTTNVIEQVERDMEGGGFKNMVNPNGIHIYILSRFPEVSPNVSLSRTQT